MIVEYLANVAETRRLIYDVWNVKSVIGSIKRSISLQHCPTVLLSLLSWSFAWLPLLFKRDTWLFHRVFFIPLGTLWVTWKRDTLGEENLSPKSIFDNRHNFKDLHIILIFNFRWWLGRRFAVLVSQITRMFWRHQVDSVCR